MATKRETDSWEISKLKPNPKQAEFFGPLGEEALQQLMADMAKFGQRAPIEATVDGRIIDGHQRVEAGRRLGWPEVDVTIVEGTPAELEQRFITANAARRQLSQLQRARCAARLVEIEKGKPKLRSQKEKQRGQIRDRVGKLLSISGREVDRLLLILNAPSSIQQLFEAGELSMVLAGKVAALTDEQKNELDRQIRENGANSNVKEIISGFVETAKTNPNALRGSYRRYLSVLDSRTRELAPQVETIEMEPRNILTDIETLTRANKLNADLLKRARTVQRDEERRRREFEKDIAELRTAVKKCA